VVLLVTAFTLASTALPSISSAQSSLPPFESTIVLPDITIVSGGGNRYEIVAAAGFFKQRRPLVALRFIYTPREDLRRGILTVQELRLNSNTGQTESSTIGLIQYETAPKARTLWHLGANVKTFGKTFVLAGTLESDTNPLLPHNSLERPPTHLARRKVPHVPDGLKFAYRGVKVKYDHPDRVSYKLNPSEFRVIAGRIFYHVHLSKSMNNLLRLPPQILGAMIGATIGFLISPSPDPLTKAAGMLLGAIIGYSLPALSQFLTEQYIVDEEGAIWLWLKKRDYEAIIQVVNTFAYDRVEYLKLGDLPTVSVALPFGIVTIVR